MNLSTIDGQVMAFCAALLEELDAIPEPACETCAMPPRWSPHPTARNRAASPRWRRR